MDFRLELHIKPWKKQIRLQDRLLLLGSCFTEHMAAQLRRHRFEVLENPHGILFNPMSMFEALHAYSSGTTYTNEDLFLQEGLWQSWEHHGKFAATTPGAALEMMNRECAAGYSFLPTANWLILTLGSAFVYEIKADSPFNPSGQKRIVANCHKVPASHFIHRLPLLHEVEDALAAMIATARSANPQLNIIFTISPVRHYREGLVENNRSKALLHTAVHAMLQHENVFYFPAYELIIDDLRDYRFYAEDMVHPNYMATRYVWEKFSAACMDHSTRLLMEKMQKIDAALNHRPRQPESAAHKAFLRKMHDETLQLQAEAPYLNLADALAYFSA